MIILLVILIVNMSALVILNSSGDERNIESRTEREEKMLRNQK